MAAPASQPDSLPETLYDRSQEWSELRDLWESDRFELAIVTGRRRVGKTSLLVPFARQVDGIYYQATRRTSREQLRSISHIFSERFDDPGLRHGSSFSGWESLFAYLIERVGDERFVLVLDEFPYLHEADSAILSELQRIIDHRLQSTQIKLVLSGSHISAMRQMESGGEPLYQRRTRRLFVASFPYHDAGRFVPSYSPRSRLMAYGIYGGLPGHLALLDPEVPLAENAARDLLHPGGRLVDEAEHRLDAFLGKAQIHYSILEAIATGEQTWSGITNRLGKSGGSISRPMDWLKEMEFVEREVPITSTKPRKSKRARYRLTDPHIRFWHQHVGPLLEAGIVGQARPEKIWQTRIEPALKDYMGPVFEEACRAWVRSGPDTLSFEPLRVGRWWDGRSEHEIDVVALSGEGEVLVGECKWGSVGTRDLQALERNARKLLDELDDPGRITKVLFSGRDLDEEALRREIDEHTVSHVQLEELYGDQ